MADLSVKYAGMTLKNPLICASGPPTDTVEGCKAASDAGFAAIVLKSASPAHVGPIGRQHAVPRFKVVDRHYPHERWNPKKGIVNMDIASAGEAGSVWGQEKYLWFINEVKRSVGPDVKVAASTAGSTRSLEAWDEFIDIFCQSECDFVELDMGYARYYTGSIDIPTVIKNAKKKLKVPLTVKTAPFLTFPVDIAKMFQDAGVDGITMYDSTFVLDFDIDTLALPIWNTWCYFPGGFSKSYTNKCIAESRRAGITTSLSASFGPWEWQDAIKSIMSGADTVQMCRKVMMRGYKEATLWLKEMNAWLDKKNYKTIAELKGKILEKLRTDLRQAIPREEPLTTGGTPSLKSVIDAEKCHGCIDWCGSVCGYFAISLKDKKAAVDVSKCAACGMCEGVCPFMAISLQPR